MEDGLLSLKWNNHKATFFEILKILREKSNFTDATLAVEGKFYPVHKLVMSTCSEYFSDIFERTLCKSPVVVLKDVRSHDIEALLDYMYLGEVNVNQNDLSSLIKTAECLRIKGLAVPDEDPTKVHKNLTGSHDKAGMVSPPLKRQRHDSDTKFPQAVAPDSSPQESATAFVNPAQIPSIPAHSAIITEPDELPIEKIEMDDAEYQDYGSEFSKPENEPENYDSTSYTGPSLQHNVKLWDEGQYKYSVFLNHDKESTLGEGQTGESEGEGEGPISSSENNALIS
ncbi:unnamed protein product, partial [Meganyctiphanes norvegica]